MSPPSTLAPPVPSTTLERNPAFAALYTHLTINVLSPTGQTIANPSRKHRHETTEALRELSFRHARRRALRYALRSLPTATTSTSIGEVEETSAEAVHDNGQFAALVVLLSRLLNEETEDANAATTTKEQTLKTSPTAALALLESDALYTSLPTHVTALGTQLSSHLSRTTLSLARILDPHPASATTDQIVAFSTSVHTLMANLQAIQHDHMTRTQTVILPLARDLLTQYQHAMRLSILTLERHIHGACARNVSVAAEYWALRARELELEVKKKEAEVVEAVYGRAIGDATRDRAGLTAYASQRGSANTTRAALKVYAEHLRDARTRLRGRSMDARRVLGEYGAVVGDVGADGHVGASISSVKESEGSVRIKDSGNDEMVDSGVTGRRGKILKEAARVYGLILADCEALKLDIARLSKS